MYGFHNDKSGIVTFGETKQIYCQSFKQRNWVLGNETVDERYEYKNLGVVKNYVGPISFNVQDNIDKTRKKAGMIFASGFTLYNVCAVPWGVLSTVGVVQYRGVLK